MMLVKLTEELIRNGARQSCRFCPIANFFNNLLNTEKYEATVGRGKVNIRERTSKPGLLGEIQQVIHLPLTAQSFIHTFDQYKAVVPIEFETDDINPEYLKTV